MKILLAVVGGLLLLIFPFIVMKKAKVTKEENTDEARKKYKCVSHLYDTCSSNRLHISFNRA